MGRRGEKEHRKKRTRLATTWRIGNMEKLNICANKRINSRTNDQDPPLLGTSQNRQNTRINNTKLLVARDEERHPKIHGKLQHLSNSKTRPTSKGSPSPPKWNTWRSLAGSLHRYDEPVTRIKRIWHHLGGSQLVHEEIILPPHQLDDYIQRDSDIISG